MEQNVSEHRHLADIYQQFIRGDSTSLSTIQQITLKNHLPLFVKQPSGQAKINSSDLINQNHEPIQSQLLPYIHQSQSQSENQKAVKKPLQIVKRSHIERKMAKVKSQHQHQAIHNISQSFHLEPNSKDLVQNHPNPKQVKNNKQITKVIANISKNLESASTHQNYFQKIVKKKFLPHKNEISWSNKEKKPHESEFSKNNIALVLNQEHNKKMHTENEIPSSEKKQKKDFKAIIGKSKKIKLELEKLNQKEKAIQLQILNYHQSTKQFLEKIAIKYNINLKNSNKYLKNNKHKIVNEVEFNKNNEFLIKIVEEQQQNERLLGEEMAIISNLVEQNKKKVSRQTYKMSISEFEHFLLRKEDFIIEEENELEEQDDKMFPLDDLKSKEKYSELMAATREKKWRLQQISLYENQRNGSLEKSRNRVQKSRASNNSLYESDLIENKANKVVVNERLKQLLFD